MNKPWEIVAFEELGGFENIGEERVLQLHRLTSHDFRYENGKYIYHDTYVGGEEFAGEEASGQSKGV